MCLGTVNSSLDLPEEEWDNTVRTNLTGSWLVSKHVGMRMRDGKRGGSIINITSIASLNRGQLPGGAAYAASKTGLGAITRVISLTCFKLIIIYLANKGEFFKLNNIYISWKCSKMFIVIRLCCLLILFLILVIFLSFVSLFLDKHKEYEFFFCLEKTEFIKRFKYDINIDYGQYMVFKGIHKLCRKRR